VLGDFLADLRQQRLRTALTILGVTWGTVAVVVLLAFGTGLEQQTR
jgi:putative ABC transport system permease protein